MVQEISFQRGIILEYIDMLLGNRNDFSMYYLSKTEYTSEKLALGVFKFAFEQLLKWSPQDLVSYFDSKMITELKLNTLVRCIRIPPEVGEDQIPTYILSLVYPDKVHMSFFDLTVRTYADFQAGKSMKLPRDFFSKTTEGRNRACICLQYVISHFFSYLSVKDLYDVFSINSTAYKLLKAFRLYSACKENYVDPIEFLHDALPDSMRNELYLHFCYFQNITGLMNRNEVTKKVDKVISEQQKIIEETVNVNRNRKLRTKKSEPEENKEDTDAGIFIEQDHRK